jgi:phosphopantothenoylcysteine decarboxylase/phosphopantothenate--cysteine ligase
MSLKGKKVVLAVSGSIAAYKTPHFVRLLIKEEAEVRVIVTEAATHFVSPLSLSTVSKNAVLADVSAGDTWNNHVEIGLWADAMIVAPCSANTLAKLAAGICDNLVCAVYLSARCPIFIAPAMDEDMWLHPSTQGNITKVRSYGNHIIPVGHGELASGLTGEGRMEEPENMVKYLDRFFSEDNKPLKGLKALVTAGPTYERIDPVRFIGNFSSGKMGIAVAEALADKGALVTLVLGPSLQHTYHSGVQTVKVESAGEMYEACIKSFAEANISVLAAAVADYQPKEKAKETLVGFALETNNEMSYASEKLREKNADMIALNSLLDEGAGFGYDTNKITLLKREGPPIVLPLQSKKDIAAAIVNQIIELRHVETIA